jgi:hypothetical protein
MLNLQAMGKKPAHLIAFSAAFTVLCGHYHDLTHAPLHATNPETFELHMVVSSAASSMVQNTTTGLLYNTAAYEAPQRIESIPPFRLVED